MGDQPTLAFETWRAGPWDHDGAPHRAPWDDHPNRITVSTVWSDAAHTTPVAFEDHDGCRAQAIERVSGSSVPHQVSERRHDWWQDDCTCPCESCEQQGDHWVAHCLVDQPLTPGIPRV